MKKLISTLLLSIIGLIGYSQVHLFDGTFEEALIKAKEENKILLVDCSSDGNT